jgi:hypothetical protein
MSSGENVGTPPVKAGEFKLEVVVIPVSDVDRAKQFYEGLGWKLDADVAPSADYRIVQLTPALAARSSSALTFHQEHLDRCRACISSSPISRLLAMN